MSDFETKTDYLIETKGLLKDRINSLGGSITNQTTFRDYLVWLDSLYEALDEKTITGLPDSLEGKCEQATTQTGKNKFNGTLYNAQVGSNGGITSSTTRVANVEVGGTSITYLPKGTYTLSIANLDYCTVLTKQGSTIIDNFANSWQSLPFTFTTTQDAYFYFTGRKSNNSTLTPSDYNAQVEVGSSASPYEPFIPNSPSPDYPQPINIATGRQVVSVCGKNLLNINNWVKGRINNSTGNIEYANNVSSMTIGETDIKFVVSQAWNSGIASDFIPISTGDYVFKYAHNREITMCIDTYDNQKARISRIVAYTQAGTPTTRTFTISDNSIAYIRIHFEVNTANVEYIVSDMQLEKGNQATTYEEYKGNDYEINLGKNLLNYSLATIKSLNTSGTWSDNVYTHNGLTITINEDKTITINGTSTAQETLLLRQTKIEYPTGTYYLSGAINGNNNLFDIRTYNYNGSGAVAQCFTGTKEINVVNNGQNYNIAIVVRSGQTLNNVVFYPMFSKSNDTNYAPYKTPIYLGEIGNYKDYIFQNTTENPLYDSNLEEGQWYIHKEIGRVVLNGSENWVIDNTYSRYSLTGYITDYNVNQRTTAKCNYYRYGDTTQDGYFALSGANNVLFLHFPTTSTNTVALFKTWLSSHNVELYYILNTPTNTLIEDEELINQLNEIEIFTVISEDFYN